MSKLAGDHVQVLVDGYDLTGDSNRVQVEALRDCFDVTTFGDAVHQFIAGQRSLTLKHSGFMNSAAAGSHPALKGAQVDGLVSVYVGQNTAPVVGDPVFSFQVQQTRYGTLPQFNRAIAFAAAFANRGTDGGWGQALAVPTTLIDSSVGTVLDQKSAANRAMVGLHVLKATETDTYSIIIEGSDTVAFSSAVTLMTFNLNGSVIGSEQQALSGTIPRYLRWRATRNGSAGQDVRFAIAYLRQH